MKLSVRTFKLLTVLLVFGVTISTDTLYAQKDTKDIVLHAIMTSLEQENIVINSQTLGSTTKSKIEIKDRGKNASVVVDGFNTDNLSGYQLTQVAFLKNSESLFIKHDLEISSEIKTNAHSEMEKNNIEILNNSANVWLRLDFKEISSLLKDFELSLDAFDLNINEQFSDFEILLTNGIEDSFVETYVADSLQILNVIEESSATKVIAKTKNDSITYGLSEGSSNYQEFLLIVIDNETDLIKKVTTIITTPYDPAVISISNFNYPKALSIESPRKSLNIFKFFETEFNDMFDANISGPIEVSEFILGLMLQSLDNIRNDTNNLLLTIKLNTARVYFEIYYDKNGYSYEGGCEDLKNRKELEENVICRDADISYIAFAEISNGEYWCVDSTGASESLTRKPSSTATQCLG